MGIRQMVRGVDQWSRTATASSRSMPSFLVVGAQKAGTTSLYDYLVQSSDVRTARTKEIHFFDHHFDRGPSWYRGQFPVEAGGRRWITGEATPYYLLHPRVPERVATTIPDVRLLVLLRNPVARAYSHFQHSRARGFEPLDSFERALDLESERTCGPWSELVRTGERQPSVEMFSYVRRSRYAPQLRRWLDRFPSESILVQTAEELFRDPETVLERTREHLGLPSTPSRPVSFEKRNSRSYESLSDSLRDRLTDELVDDIADVEEIIGRPTGWNR